MPDPNDPMADPLDAILADYLQLVEGGQVPDREALLAQHPVSASPGADAERGAFETNPHFAGRFRPTSAGSELSSEVQAQHHRDKAASSVGPVRPVVIGFLVGAAEGQQGCGV